MYALFKCMHIHIHHILIEMENANRMKINKGLFKLIGLLTQVCVFLMMILVSVLVQCKRECCLLVLQL